MKGSTRVRKQTGLIQGRSVRAKRIFSPKAAKPTFQFVYMGDSWVIGGNLTGEAIFNGVLYATSKRKPSFVIHGGDGVFSGGADQYRCLKFKLKKYIPNIPFIMVPGNHDGIITGSNPNKKYNFANYISNFPRKFTPNLDFTVSFLQDRVRVVAMNTVQGFNSQGQTLYGLTNGQLDYLEKQLTPSRFNIVTMHVPLKEWTSGFSKQKARLLKIINQKKVPLVLQSHAHEYRKVTGKVTTFITSGGAGAALDPGNIFHYVQIQVTNGKVSQISRKEVNWIGSNLGKAPCNCPCSSTQSGMRSTTKAARVRSSFSGPSVYGKRASRHGRK
ncbi:metallophosphoesterase family protein [Brevibacillus centrosporus]|uniref:metallophosphoesterase family protein n=1 Tax=Brevibacillus centrosporus TaxID=54910 RepID=UPI00380F5C8E